ncbi:MAG: Arm DNA-binding domain-containing protein [Bacteroidota bacterium]
MNLLHVSFWLRKNKSTKDGLNPIYCRVTIEGQRKDFSTGFCVREEDWNINAHRVRGGSTINQGLLNIEAQLREAYINETREGENLTA